MVGGYSKAETFVALCVVALVAIRCVMSGIHLRAICLIVDRESINIFLLKVH